MLEAIHWRGHPIKGAEAPFFGINKQTQGLQIAT